MIDLSAPALTPDERGLLAERRIAGVCLFGRNVVDRFQLADYVAELRDVGGPDLVVGIDQEGGGVLRLTDVPTPPAAMALGAADDASLTEAVAAATARGLRAVGVNMDFAPVADVNVNPANPVIADRAFGAEPTQVARHVAAFVRGLQSEGVAATLKHFPGHGDTDTDSHLALPRLHRNLETLDAVDLVPFRAGIEAGAAVVMSAHIVLPALDPEMPGTLSRAVLHGLLRERLGFDGLVVTDALDMRAIEDRWSAAEAAVLALAAGADLPLAIGTVAEHRATLAAIEAAYADGRLADAERAASQARLRAFLGRFPADARPNAANAWRDGDEALLDDAARRGIVALGSLPRLEPGGEVVLVAAETVRASAASQVTTRPVDALSRALEQRGLRVRRVGLGDSGDQDAAGGTPSRDLGPIATTPATSAIVFASTSRTPIGDAEVAVAWRAHQAAERSGVPFVHVAMWNPYSAARLPGPALLAFGFGARSAAAAADALMGAPTLGKAPAPITPATSA
jgi:beta-N-acetylhexosaminidase